MKRPARPLSMNETLAQNRKAEQLWASSFGKPLRDDAPMPKEKRTYVKRQSDDDSEAPVQKAVNKLLATHPLILWAARINGGAMDIPDGKGGYRPMFFYRIIRQQDDDLVLLDNMFQRRDGRFGMIECKKPSWTKPTTDLERKQLAMILTCKYAGGLAGFAANVDQAKLIIEG